MKASGESTPDIRCTHAPDGLVAKPNLDAVVGDMGLISVILVMSPREIVEELYRVLSRLEKHRSTVHRDFLRVLACKEQGYGYGVGGVQAALSWSYLL